LRRERKKCGFDSLLPPPCGAGWMGQGRWWWVESLVASRLAFFLYIEMDGVVSEISKTLASERTHAPNVRALARLKKAKK
jgi:hypothetical protein